MEIKAKISHTVTPEVNSGIIKEILNLYTTNIQGYLEVKFSILEGHSKKQNCMCTYVQL